MGELPYSFNRSFKGRSRGANQADKMNGLETAYSQYLEAAYKAGRIQGWWFHPMGLRLAHKTFYHPDFMVMLNDGMIEFHETKGGFFEEDAKVKIKTANEKFPFTFWIVKKASKGIFTFERVGASPSASQEPSSSEPEEA